jgi:hypothetical protein
VLKLETILRVNKIPNINRHGMEILDRWALNQPDDLKTMETRNDVGLMVRVLDQQYLEQEVLERPENQARLDNGLTLHEILEMNEIQTSL